MPTWRSWDFWQRVAAVLALLISVGSAAFTGMQWRDAHNQFLLSTKPHVDFFTNDDPDEPPVGVAVSNAGPGPATIKSVVFYVDRKPVRDADETGKTYAKLSPSELGYEVLESGDTLPVGEKVWLINYRKPKGGKVNQKNIEQFSDFVDQHLALEITFCSVVQDDLCWTKCSAPGRCK